MTWSEIGGISLLFIGMVYSALSIGIPEIRAYWWNTSTRLGTVSSIGFAVFIWGIPLSILATKHGLIPWPFAYLLLCCLLAVVFTVGYLRDVSK